MRRFCGCRVVLKQARDRMRTSLPGAIPWSGEGYHAAFHALTATLDHVVPHADGGGNDADNIVTTCWPCNFGRGGYSLAEFGLIDPRLHPAVVNAWDGLGRLEAASGRPRDKTSSDAWFASIDRIQPTLSERILAFVESCVHLGVSCSVNEVMIIRMRVEGIVVDQFGVEPNGDVSIPWWIGEQKTSFRDFAGAVAEAIPGAAVHESPKQWIVDKNGRKVHVLELLEASTAVRAALAGLHAALKKALRPSG